MHSFLAIKCFWTTDNWQYCDHLLAFTPMHGAHTVHYLSEQVRKTLQTYDISDRIMSQTADNASNNVAMFPLLSSANVEALNESLSTSSLNFPPPLLSLVVDDADDGGGAHMRNDAYSESEVFVPCLAHVLQLALKAILSADAEQPLSQLHQKRVSVHRVGHLSQEPCGRYVVIGMVIGIFTGYLQYFRFDKLLSASTAAISAAKLLTRCRPSTLTTRRSAVQDPFDSFKTFVRVGTLHATCSSELRLCSPASMHT